ncbi:MAG: NAD(P)-dependent oxidoreductase [Candidatus Omnitrophica bacterium]|nr:NAD(P)-dependent oxidoreductase [Candidatus Omnitrophota bacterium]
MKVLITGATGFIGKRLAVRIAGRGHSVIACGRSLDKLKNLSQNIIPTYLALEDKGGISQILKKEKPDIIYHAAALIYGSRENLMRVNSLGTENLFKASLDSGVKKIVHLSSVAAVSGNEEVPLEENVPLKANGPYGESKIEAEKIALKYRKKGLKIAIIRPPMVYGPFEPHGMPYLIGFLRKRMLPVPGSGENRIHMVSVENLVDVLELALSKDEIYEGAYFVADKEALTLRELLFFITEVAGAKGPFVIPEGVVRVISKLPFIGKRISSLRRDRIYSIDRLQKKLGYEPRVPVREGLRKAVLSYS